MGRDEAHFGEKLIALFAIEAHFGAQFGTEADDSLAKEQSIFGSAKANDICAGILGHGFQIDLERGSGIGQSGAIDVQQHVVSMREIRQSFDLFHAV